MDLFRLDPDTLLPKDLVEGYSSLVWTERHEGETEFELTTPKITHIKELLPEGTYVSHLETDEIMQVETHSIEKDENDNNVLLVKGRSLMQILLEDRVMVGWSYGGEWNAYQPYTNPEVISAIIWNYLANDSGRDALLGTGELNPAFRVPNLVVTDSTSINEERRPWFFKDGEVYSQLKELLEVHNLGVRAVRPVKSSANVVSLDTSFLSPSRGVVTLTPTTNIDTLRIDVYQGLDRTKDQEENSPVVFTYESGDLKDPSYLFSSKDIKNMAVVRTSVGTQEVWLATESITPPVPLPTGDELHVLYFDGGDANLQAPVPPEEPVYEPYPNDLTPEEEDEIDAINQERSDKYNEAVMVYDQAVVFYNQRVANYQEEQANKALLELKKHSRKIMLDGTISPLSSLKYREQYFLGDKVTLSAEYGVEETMIVSEYVRTEDHTGDRGYPTLVLSS